MASNDSYTHELPPGERFFDRYRIQRRIADGGMASIYLAIDETSGLPVAIKVLFSYYVENTIIRTRFLDEGRIQAMLRHPNIVHVYRVLARPVLSFVMEYVDGQTLEDHLKDHGPMNEREILEIMLPVMSAIGFAHSKGIIHRDLKPSNILVRPSPRGIEPKVMDFGVAKVTTGRDLTAAGTTVGTLHYMSPEQIVGSRNIDSRADIYSLGVTLYKLCTGEVPFNAATEFALMMAQVEAAPVPPRSLRKEVSPELEAIILKALEKEPARRFQSIKEFTSALMMLGDPNAAEDIETVTLPSELLEYAMMADKVATDRTEQYTRAALELRASRASDGTETLELVAPGLLDPTDEMNARVTSQMPLSTSRSLGRPSDATRPGDDRTVNASLQRTRVGPSASIPALGAGKAGTAGQPGKKPAAGSEPTPLAALASALSEAMQDGAGGETVEDTVSFSANSFSANSFSADSLETQDKSTKRWIPSGRSIVAVDRGADSHEVTGLKVSKRNYDDAIRLARAQSQAHRLGTARGDASSQPPKHDLRGSLDLLASLEPPEPPRSAGLEESTKPERPAAHASQPSHAVPAPDDLDDAATVSQPLRRALAKSPAQSPARRPAHDAHRAHPPAGEPLLPNVTNRVLSNRPVHTEQTPVPTEPPVPRWLLAAAVVVLLGLLSAIAFYMLQ